MSVQVQHTHNPVTWKPLEWQRAKRVAKLSQLGEFVMLHEDFQCDVRLWYDALEGNFYKEFMYDDKPSQWRWSPAPVLVDVSTEDGDG